MLIVDVSIRFTNCSESSKSSKPPQKTFIGKKGLNSFNLKYKNQQIKLGKVGYDLGINNYNLAVNLLLRIIANFNIDYLDHLRIFHDLFTGDIKSK